MFAKHIGLPFSDRVEKMIEEKTLLQYLKKSKYGREMRYTDTVDIELKEVNNNVRIGDIIWDVSTDRHGHSYGNTRIIYGFVKFAYWTFGKYAAKVVKLIDSPTKTKVAVELETVNARKVPKNNIFRNYQNHNSGDMLEYCKLVHGWSGSKEADRVYKQILEEEESIKEREREREAKSVQRGFRETKKRLARRHNREFPRMGEPVRYGEKPKTSMIWNPK
jgi:hypothetical protein